MNRNMNHRVIFVLMAALLSPVTAAPMTAATPVTQQTTSVNEQGLWIDVRSNEEFLSGHLTAAANIPLPEVSQLVAKIAPDKKQPIFLYCHSGRRAEAAKLALQKLGYERVVNMGGYADLLKKGYR